MVVPSEKKIGSSQGKRQGKMRKPCFYFVCDYINTDLCADVEIMYNFQ